MRKLNLIFFLFIIICPLSAQNIKGKILNTSNSPIAHATIQIGDDFGTISNQEGSFSININNFKLKDSVYISCLGFEKLKLLIKDFTSKDYILKENVTKLPEVILTNTLVNVKSLLNHVRTSIISNYNNRNIYLEHFLRKTEYINSDNIDFKIIKASDLSFMEVESFNNDLDKLENSFKNNKSVQYIDYLGHLYILDDNNSKLKVNRAVKFLDESNTQSLELLYNKGKETILKLLDDNNEFTVKSGLFKISDSFVLNSGENKLTDTINSISHAKKITHETIKYHNFFDKSIVNLLLDERKYIHKIEGTTLLNNKKIYVVSFVPKRHSSKYTGNLYINSDDYSIARIDYSFYKTRIDKKVNLKFFFGVKYKVTKWSGSVLYEKNKDGFYYPRHLIEEVTRYLYLNRPLKFIDNSNRKNKLSLKFEFEGTYKEKIEILILDKNEITNIDFDNYSENDEIDFERPKYYDDKIWKGFNILEPLNEMKKFVIEE